MLKMLRRAARTVVRAIWYKPETLRLMYEHRQELLQIQLNSRLVQARALWRATPPPNGAEPIRVIPQDFNAVLRDLRALHPHIYPAWERINLRSTPEEYRARPEGSCSVGKRANDLAFAGFIAPYLRGRVLDVGCGPYAVPSYLREYPTGLVCGLDPLDPLEPHPFTFAKGVAESLPFPDAAFDVLVAATSLDHAFSLDRTLSEMTRVLKAAGTLLVWDGFVKGSPRYDPADERLVPIDRFHLFHFDEGWFEQMMHERGFEIMEKIVYDPSPGGGDYAGSHFYALRQTEARHA